MSLLGGGLYATKHYEDALSVREAELSTYRRFGAPEEHMLATQGNLSLTYRALGRLEDAVPMLRDLYSGYCRLMGEDGRESLSSAYNYANCLFELRRFKEVKALMSKAMPISRRALGDNDRLTLRIRWIYAMALYKDDGATLNDVREAVTTLVETERTARRVLGGSNPTTASIEDELRDARAKLRARELRQS